jgi:hypothetical protein
MENPKIIQSKQSHPSTRSAEPAIDPDSAHGSHHQYPELFVGDVSTFLFGPRSLVPMSVQALQTATQTIMLNVSGKTTLVTGASRGHRPGHRICKPLRQRGDMTLAQ